MQRGFALPVLIVFILIVLAAAGAAYYFLLKPQANPLPAVPQPSLKPAASSIPSASVPAVNRGSSELLGLTFEMPKDYRVLKETEEEYFKRANGNLRKNFESYILYPPAEFSESFYVLPESESNPDKAVMTVWVFKNPDNLDAVKFFEKYWYYPFVWGDFTSIRNEIAPKDIELIGGKEGQFGIVGYRDGKPKMIYLPLKEKNLMAQIQFPGDNVEAKEILRSFKFE